MFDETMGIPKKEMTAVSHAHEPLSYLYYYRYPRRRPEGEREASKSTSRGEHFLAPFVDTKLL
jgi:hypothetical protein